MKSLNILTVAACPFPAPRGTPTRILRLAESVASYGHSVHVATYHLGDAIETDQFKIHRIDDVAGYQRLEAGPSYLKLWVDFKLSRTIKELLAKHDFDVIHAHHYEGLLAGLAGRSGRSIPIVYDAHTLASVELADYSLYLPTALKRWIGEQFDRRLPRRADWCVTASRGLQEELVRIGAAQADRITTVANGVESQHFADVQRTGCARERKQLIFTGNLAPYQGVDLMIAAFAALCERRDDVELMILTRDPVDELQRTVTMRGLANRVRFATGTFQELPFWLADADIALNPRIRCDGVPQKLLNYMAAGCPIVSFSGSSKHLIDGESALLVDEPEAGAFMQAIDGLLDAPDFAARLGRNARDIALRDLSWEVGSADLIDLFLRLVNE